MFLLGLDIRYKLDIHTESKIMSQSQVKFKTTRF